MQRSCMGSLFHNLGWGRLWFVTIAALMLVDPHCPLLATKEYNLHQIRQNFDHLFIKFGSMNYSFLGLGKKHLKTMTSNVPL